MPATVLGALVGSLLDAYGRKPVVPDLPTLDIAKEQRASITANQLALPGLEKLATETNRFNFDEISKMLERAVPGFTAGIKSAGANATALARGEIPDDVSRGVQSSSAARSLGGGFGGSGLARNLTARDLGLTSLNLTGEGQNRLLGLGAFARNNFGIFDFTNAFITPMQKLNFEREQNAEQWQVKWLRNQITAAPDPDDVALAEGLDNMFHTFANIGLSYFGQSVATNKGGATSGSGGSPGGGGGMGSWMNFGGGGGAGAGAGSMAGASFGGM